jgi:nucleoside triphosphatase
LPEQLFPEPTIGALIFNDTGQLFLMRSHKFKGQYVIPGGHIELGETMEEALHREVREETGLSVRDVEFVGIQEFVFDPVFWKKRHFIFIDFSCTTDESEVVLNEEGQSYCWASLEECGELDIEPYTRKAIEMYNDKGAL